MTMPRSRWKDSNSRLLLRKPLGGSSSSTRCGKSRSFICPAISLATAHLLQSSSASRFMAGAFEFFILSQSDERPERKRNPCGLQFLIRRTAHDFLCLSSCLHFPRSGAGPFVKCCGARGRRSIGRPAEMVALVLRRKTVPMSGQLSVAHRIIIPAKNREGGHVE
jgi:hypothetical protein